MTDRATRLRELRRRFCSEQEAFGLMWQALVLHREWAKLCGHFQAVDAVDSFMQFVEGDDE